MRPLLALFVVVAIPLGLYVYVGVVRPHYQWKPAPPKPLQPAQDRFAVELTATFSAESQQSTTEQAAPALLLELREQGVRREPIRIEAWQTLRVELPKVTTGSHTLIVSARISDEQAERHHALHLRILRNGRPLPGGEKTFWLPPADSGEPLRATFPFNVSPADHEADDAHDH